ncbi:hypothetical protein BBF96_01405 [Anoxybacter fermentans]|uniref:Uncharacterized protein n=1 Tax=Anoxybacter fermentans TaxID=1323375 RepID=A0A3Q9HP00_9FIRM|nr:hypothetical protein [Anoxybacter fermentans]AZR72167.1 hypothetical protein BBF96_01405 [Anoxybacter fermentans]
MDYYFLLKDCSVKTIKNVCSIKENQKNDKIIVLTEKGQEEILLQDVLLHGDEEYWKQVMELLNTIDRLKNNMVKKQLRKVWSIGYLMGLFKI